MVTEEGRVGLLSKVKQTLVEAKTQQAWIEKSIEQLEGETVLVDKDIEDDAQSWLAEADEMVMKLGDLMLARARQNRNYATAKDIQASIEAKTTLSLIEAKTFGSNDVERKARLAVTLEGDSEWFTAHDNELRLKGEIEQSDAGIEMVRQQISIRKERARSLRALLQRTAD